ncbi:hypothetical protein MASR1M12_16770 [Erysipelotrichia bacterium]
MQKNDDGKHCTGGDDPGAHAAEKLAEAEMPDALVAPVMPEGSVKEKEKINEKQ